MYLFAIAFTASLFAIALAPQLPPLIGIYLAVPIALMLAWRYRSARPALLGLSLGLVLAVWHGLQLTANLLPNHLTGQDITLQGHLVNEAERQGRRWRFDLQTQAPGLPQRWQLSWYGAPDWLTRLPAGAPLELVVRAKPPRSFLNPQGFDYKLWQLRRQVGAVGYVRNGISLRGAAQAATSSSPRDYLRQWLARAEVNNDDVLAALLVGDRSAISDERWQLFRATGTNHLMAISGLHVGLAAAIGYFLGVWLGRCLSLVCPWPAVYMAFAGGALLAIVYSALAGFALPTQRALAMLLLFYFWRWRGMPLSGMQVLAGALIIVGVLDPLAVLDAGLWLSFIAVFSLLLMFAGQKPIVRRRWIPWVGSQLAVFVALLVPLLLFFGEFSLVAPLANIVAIALVSVWVVPLLFASAVCSFVWSAAANGLLQGADLGLQVLWWWLEHLVAITKWFGAAATLRLQLADGALILLALGCLLLLLPVGLRFRSLAVLLVSSALFLPPARPPGFAMTVLDVGQGLAVVVQSQQQALVYDTGPWFGENLNAGADIVTPYIRSLGLSSVELLMVSHHHSDHAGGAAGLLEELPVSRLIIGEPLQYLQAADSGRAERCDAEQSLQLGELDVEILSLPEQHGAQGNNASCIVLLQWRGYRVLLPGDAEAVLEPALAAKVGAVDVVVAPHHGSRSSSSAALVGALQPDYVVFSAGFANRHGHPHEDVVARYRRAGAHLHNTATDGAVIVTGTPQGELIIRGQRQMAQRYWR
ncbi:DNA internalization-related competence protein ComEC/Rec2 [Gilvimarinus agarilyticus]|uniref:DNA internalization-related competence protein ComEC/Rec2 n=1 Tax=Gilvimarinus sp. 2_MG-2023 TaxID=3062666 RepID=UPI001C082BA3|nr:DNA internalization-related competence protein ComEC/Rec2 [Gilvimarinus sp. 2_MG-2023]MBU2887427.1 DNA internalization-related competence protein ComEC/Rec2 [Gilvimarinus agarilyticus]MDO6572086.1 DNA internalization-related competence protein ComEC/Rec2 [Gilvimarinus sp. 2_MG-2023]